MMKTTLYLIRHAQSYPNAACHYSAWPLSSTGERQAETLADLLEPLGIEQVFSSPFLRCLQTVEPFAKKLGVEVVVEPDLRERLVAHTIVDGFYDIWRRSWDDFHFALPGCETSADAQGRFVSAISTILRQRCSKTIAISTHGNVIGLFLNSVDGTAGRSEAEQLTNPDVVRISVEAGVFRWDRDFRLAGLEEIATDHRATPVDR